MVKGPEIVLRPAENSQKPPEEIKEPVECGWKPALKSVVQPARDRTYLYF